MCLFPEENQQPVLRGHRSFEELNDTKNEEIAANPQQHKEKSLEAQETKLSHDRKNWKGLRSTLMSRRHFLRISTQLDISEIQTTADQARDHFSKTKQIGIQPTCWRVVGETCRTEKSIVELNSTRTTV